MINGTRMFKYCGICILEAEINNEDNIYYLSLIINDRQEPVSADSCACGAYRMPLTEKDKMSFLTGKIIPSKKDIDKIVNIWNTHPVFTEYGWRGWQPDKNMLPAMHSLGKTLASTVGEKYSADGFINETAMALRRLVFIATSNNVVTMKEVKELISKEPCHWEIIQAIEFYSIPNMGNADKKVCNYARCLIEFGWDYLPKKIFRKEVEEFIKLAEKTSDEGVLDAIYRIISRTASDKIVDCLKNNDYVSARKAAEEIPEGWEIFE
jgi:hypothetical protein